jgi:(5-formylfuran-3-yl)methyl phosphate synthase
MLASVTDEREGRLVAALGADIVDAKNPVAGALGALPPATVAAIRAGVPPHVPVSATIGDPSDDVEATVTAVLRMAEAGADIVKIGLNKKAGAERTLERLASLELGDVRLVGVLLADQGIDLAVVGLAGAAGFAGLMLDTGDKRRGALPDIVPAETMAGFVGAVHAARMFAGLAGSLQAAHVARLLPLGPDVLGFRGGLCRQGERTATIEAEAVRGVRRVIPVCDAARTDACRLPRPNAMAPRQTEDVA